MAVARDWYARSGAQALRDASAVSFSEYAARARSGGGSHAPATLDDDRRQIELDLARARASVREFVLRESDESGSDGEDSGEEGGGDARLAPVLAMLRDILLAYSLRNPRVGYVQGHADVVCFLIGNINERRDAEEVFWVYASLIERVFPEDFFARTPKLHGFHVDNRLFKELVTRKLVDLTLVTSLLSCKWFVSIWVGHLPLDLLCKVWDAMLAEEEGGAILHLLLGLHFFQRATDSLAAHNEAEEDWDSSRLYQIILRSSQDAEADLDPQGILHQAQSMYSLNDESIEDMRSTLRLDPQLQRAEFTELGRTTKFNAGELEQLHEEFTFVRFHTKVYERVKLRGVRQEYFESLVAREFSTWPVDICGRLFQVMKPDGYGNASFSSLAQMLSVLARGEHEDKAALLFAVADVHERKVLNQDGINQLADLLCCLFANKALAGTSPQPLSGAERDALLRNNSEQSPLLRSQFRQKFEALAAGRGTLDWDSWLQLARTDSEILSLMEWDLLSRSRGAAGSQHHRKKVVQYASSAMTSLHSPAADVDGKPHQRNGHGKNRLSGSSGYANGISSSVVSPAAVASTPEPRSRGPSVSSPAERTDEHRRVSLLSKQMKKKYKVSRAMVTSDSGLRRNPFDAQFPAAHAAMSSNWCQCTIS